MLSSLLILVDSFYYGTGLFCRRNAPRYWETFHRCHLESIRMAPVYNCERVSYSSFLEWYLLTANQWNWAHALIIVLSNSTLKISVAFFLMRITGRTGYHRFLWGVIGELPKHVGSRLHSLTESLNSLYCSLYHCLPWHANISMPPRSGSVGSCSPTSSSWSRYRQMLFGFCVRGYWYFQQLYHHCHRCALRFYSNTNYLVPSTEYSSKDIPCLYL